METVGQTRKVTYSILSSSVLHAGLVVGVLAMNLTLPEIKPREVIQFEVMNSGSPAAQAPARTPEPQAVKEEAPTAAPAIPVAPAPKVAKTLPVKASHMAAPAVMTPAPSMDDDSSSSTVAEEAAAEAAPVAALDDHALDEDLDRADSEAAQAIQAKGAPLKEVDDVIDESEVLATKAREDQQAEADALAKESAARRAKEQAAIEKAHQEQVHAMALEKARMKAESDKKAALAAAERAQAQSEAEEKFRAARAAAIAAAAQTAQEREAQARQAMAEADSATNEAAAQGANEADAALDAERAAQAQAAAAKAGSGGSSVTAVDHVRNLEDLRQMPGNRHPSYEEEDRLAGRKGAVIFYAFITKEGLPSEFKLVQSSGHKNLDYKTLKAIRDWRFYPGQEGWVEIPFQWDLKGEPQLIRGTLRKVSQK